METKPYKIYIDNNINDLRILTTRLQAKIVRIPINDIERKKSIDSLGNTIYDEIQIQQHSQKKAKQEQEINENKQKQARLDKLKRYLLKVYPMYVDEQCKYILTNYCNGYTDNDIKTTIQKCYNSFNSYHYMNKYVCSTEAKSKAKEFVDYINTITYNDIISNCIYNSFFMGYFLNEINDLLRKCGVSTTLPTSYIQILSKEFSHVYMNSDIIIYRIFKFISAADIDCNNSNDIWITIKHNPNIITKIKNDLNL